MAKKRGKAKKTTERKRITVALDVALRRRLGAYSGWRGITEQQVVAEALKALLTGFSVTAPGAKSDQLDQSPAEDEGEPGATILRVA
jgi:hypothetical protein